MVTVRKLSLAQASTYYSKDNYYTKEQGEFYGRLKDELGLEDLTHESFNQLLRGINPSTGESLVASKSNKESVPAFDFTFSPPKSVSILYELGMAKNEKIAEILSHAHNNAVNTALSHIEKEEIKTRVQKNGKRVTIQTGNLIAAKFQHDINRALEPQLHTHSVIFNFTKGKDGKFRSLDASHLLKKGSPIIHNLGQFYRESLKNELQKAGFEIRDIDKSKSFFELKNASDDLVQAFSSRTQDIKVKVEELKKTNPNLSKSQLSLRAFFNTRSSKKEVDRDEIRAENIKLMAKYANIDNLLSSFAKNPKKELIKKEFEVEKIPKEEELIKLISVCKSQIQNKKHRTPLNIAVKVAAKLDKVSVAIDKLYNQIKNEEVKTQKQFQNMHEVLINSLQSTKLNTQKLFSKFEELKREPDLKLKFEERIENGKSNNRDRLIESYHAITNSAARAKQSNNRNVGYSYAETSRGGISRTDTQRDDFISAGTTTRDYVVTKEDLRRAEELHQKMMENKNQKEMEK